MTFHPSAFSLCGRLLLTGLGLFALAGCQFEPPVVGSGTITSESREVTDYKRVRVVGSSKVTFQLASEYRCEITADDNLLPLIQSEVSGDELVISFERSISPSQTVEIALAGPALSEFGIVGSGQFAADGVDAEAFKFVVTGSGKAVLKGLTKDLDISISGSGSVSAAELTAENAKVRISGSGSADLDVSRSLSVRVAGSGKVKYSGDAFVEQTIAGSGSVTQVQREAQTEPGTLEQSSTHSSGDAGETDPATNATTDQTEGDKTETSK